MRGLPLKVDPLMLGQMETVAEGTQERGEQRDPGTTELSADPPAFVLKRHQAARLSAANVALVPSLVPFQPQRKSSHVPLAYLPCLFFVSVWRRSNLASHWLLPFCRPDCTKSPCLGLVLVWSLPWRIWKGSVLHSCFIFLPLDFQRLIRMSYIK